MIIPPLIIAVPNVCIKNTVISVRLFEERSLQWAASFIKSEDYKPRIEIWEAVGYISARKYVF